MRTLKSEEATEYLWIPCEGRGRVDWIWLETAASYFHVLRRSRGASLERGRGRGQAQLLEFMGVSNVKIHAYTHRSAAQGSLTRIGHGARLKHVNIQDIWLQEQVMSGRVVLIKTPRAENHADMGTKSPHAS